ncbi:3-oxoadipate CoA-transferase alpha subunit [Alteribacillus persepolensis]|uniref:3-oxoadipate CoA-transferase alpha subunit n=1 Tax=Alteribacillus persepolensis TaxID=568899 RepID=A0A1G8DSI3_9BACI|nr:3-oxoacid CoA-transferase subunit A [Alteribacillus persepolensis]SDH60521.1 3-oxoadipate CoA-transferase alpha subunit [Alteribacillus persepolensis]
MIHKKYENEEHAVADIPNDSTVLVGGFGGSGLPSRLITALKENGATGLTIVSNNIGAVSEGVATLISNQQVKKIICSFPVGPHANELIEYLETGRVELELVPQGTLAERIRAGGAGISAFYTPTAAHTELGEGKESRVFNNREHLLEYAITGDYALIKAHRADRWGNLVYRKAQRNFNPVMATAAQTTIAEVDEIVEVGDMSAEEIISPSVYVHRLVEIASQEERGKVQNG